MAESVTGSWLVTLPSLRTTLIQLSRRQWLYLGSFPDYQGQQPVTPDTIFRGSTPAIYRPVFVAVLDVEYSVWSDHGSATDQNQCCRRRSHDHDAEWLGIQNGSRRRKATSLIPRLVTSGICEI